MKKSKNKKLIITGMGNDEFRHWYIFRKSSDIIDSLIDFFYNMGFDSYDVDCLCDCETGKKKKINWLIDNLYRFNNNCFDIDLFIGNKKVIIVVRTKKRKMLISYLENNSIFIEPKSRKSKMVKLKK